jgi:hypothetical protein
MANARSNTLNRWLRAGLTTGVIDGLFSSMLSAVFYHSTVARLWQGVASTLIGAGAIGGGAAPVAIGLVMHFGVALTWSAIFLVAFDRLAWLRRAARTTGGAIAVAAIFGPLIWMTMSLAVIPALTHRPATINYRWWVQFFGHIPFVAVPIVIAVRRK